MMPVFYYLFHFFVQQKNTQSRRQKKLEAYDLSALSEFLPEQLHQSRRLKQS
jgi:hypothetical protein